MSEQLQRVLSQLAEREDAARLARVITEALIKAGGSADFSEIARSAGFRFSDPDAVAPAIYELESSGVVRTKRVRYFNAEAREHLSGRVAQLRAELAA